ncbi:lipopolysaccharide biosynthesis protein [Vibrio sp. CAU 1672]|uniref:lipopolysaccharide biosynthesis protein n=1 Tax=Vibrio sp. CAU 1672 TaxID=3032594 RepID=UPI0023D9F35A|nr:lipopolysaccharide biosynthesis protein [Vibrio sp. CAU 1672]MDF2152156.1 lipopolysaccharide biosynthesis protein [Vibrio sp. CAU 1672]
MSKALANMSIFAVALVINKSISLLMLPVLPHFLSPTQMGTLELLMSFGFVAALCVGLALHEVMYRFVGVRKTPRTRHHSLSQIYSLSVLISFSVVLLLVITLFSVAVPAPFRTIELLMLILSVGLEGAIAIGTAWLRMQNDKARTLLNIMVTTTVMQVSCILILLSYSPDISSVIAAGLFANLTQFIWLKRINRYRFILPKPQKIKLYLRYSMPLMLSAILAFCLNGAERWFIGTTDLATLGVYAIAAKFSLGMCILVQPFGMWWMPRRFAYLESKPITETTNITHLGIIYVAALSVVVAGLAFIVISLLLPYEYQDALLYVFFLLPIAMLKEWNELLNVAILYKQNTRWLLGINIISASVALSLLFGLPHLGIFGIFIALYLAQCCKTVLTYAAGQLCMPLPFNLNLLVVLHMLSGAALFMIYAAQAISATLVVMVMFVSLFMCIAWRYLPASTRDTIELQVGKWQHRVKRVWL